MIFKIRFFALVLTLALFFGCHKELVRKMPVYDYSGMNDETKENHKKIEELLFLIGRSDYPIKIHPATRITKFKIDHKSKIISLELSEPFSTIPFREKNVKDFYHELRNSLDSDYHDYKLQIITLDEPIENLVPNYFRSDSGEWDNKRLAKPQINRPSPVVRNVNKGFEAENGLAGYNVALWHSHGWYYDNKLDRWMWQRPRLFGTVEDLLPASFVIPYLVPMLENAGASVFVPRERDIQANEIIIDNDSIFVTDNPSSYAENRLSSSGVWSTGKELGFAIGHPPYEVNFNPFESGTYRFTFTDSAETAHIEWTPEIPQDGFYAVYVSYKSNPENTDDALYSVYHSGGITKFKINQQIGGGTWIYLGTFKFNRGYNSALGKVTLSNASENPGKKITADGVKFGGGMGSVLRNGRTSQRPKYAEGSRYYIQTAGFPDTLVYNLNDNSDYKDDYQGRAEWANFLHGAPNKDRSHKGMGIPIDVLLAFHTDAGITHSDSAIGTMMIYSIIDADTQTVFPDGVSRLANRDLSDIMQTQIVDDIRRLFDPKWTRRILWETQNSEAFRPNMPTTNLELLSHQNLWDMQFALDPRFRFHASRAIYKSILRFLALQNKTTYAVQPLPVDHFSAVFDSSGNIRLSWNAVIDPLERTAEAEQFKIYTRLDDGGFDNGILSAVNSFTLNNPKPGVIYSFKVTAINSGGESFPSEILAVCKITDDKNPVLIVNGFDRIAPPQVIKYGDYSGFAYNLDAGVPDKYDLNFVGEQFDFNSTHPWESNDRPGHGASYADQETKIIAGNTFDYPFIHGSAIKSAGYSFVSCSDEVIMDGFVNMQNYSVVDLIMGEEKETGWQRAELDSLKGTDFKTFPEKLKRPVKSFLDNGGSLFLSGAYIGSDLFEGEDKNYPDINFAKQLLKFDWITDHAVKTGGVFSVNNPFLNLPAKFTFNTDYNSDIYRVEAPDAIAPANGSKTILRYAENGFSAAIAYRGKYQIVAMGFPFETIISKTDRDEVMRSVLQFLLVP